MSKKMRYPAVPLVTVDPYFNIWSMSDNLYDNTTKHWSERKNPMSGFISVDDKWYRFMGTLKTDKWAMLKDPRIIQQKACEVFATKTVYEFENDVLSLEVTFRTPLLLDDLALMSRPVSYISYKAEYKDGKEHNTRVYFEISSVCCANDTETEIELEKTESCVFCGVGDKDTLSKTGDDVLIDWGYMYLTAPESDLKILDTFDRVEIFHWKKDREGITGKRKVSDGFPVLSAMRDFGNTKKAEGFVCLAYDDLYSIEYFGEKLKGYWTKNGDTIEDVLKKAIDEYDIINEKCDIFDYELRQTGETISTEYADLLCLTYRQVIAGHKLCEKDGKLLFFSKECGSNGCIGTVDITYPSMPMFLLYAPELVEGMLNPVFEFAENNHGWQYEFAPHDVGCYPKSNGQVYGYDEKLGYCTENMQMPIEESGNMLLCTAVLCKVRNDIEYAKEHFEILKQWADYLVNIGWNPENQLCTDDFAGHLAHNCNLSIKGILAIAAFGYICDKLDKDGSEYYNKSKEYAEIWEKEARDSDHYKLAFDKEGSWSLKYNLIWDRFFSFGIFDEKISKAEVEFYKTKFLSHGIALDSRENYTKSDWQMWTACLTDDREYLDMITRYMWKFANDTEDRIPFTDFYRVDHPDCEGWFRNRTVQGGIFAPLLFK